MRFYFISVLLALLPLSAFAQNRELLTLRVEARLDYMQEYVDDFKINDNSGFKGRYLNLRMDGSPVEGLSYSYRQRLNKTILNSSFFDATDWLTLTYKYRSWSVSAGKQVLCVTHLPQIAAAANAHLLIAKSERNGRTFTQVTTLDREGRKREIARIIGGAEITAVTLQSAEEMLAD